VELSLMESRVTACADALVACGEDERAGGLYVRLGRRHQAAESFVKAGAIEALEEAHAELAFAEGGRRLEARLAFERFEALFLVGRRIEALTSLERAVQQSMQHPVYVEVLNGFRARLPAAGGVVLTAGDDVVRVVSRFPLVLGRGEDSAVRIDSPLVSRAHVDIQRRAGELVVNDLVSSGGTRIDDAVIAGPTPLATCGCIDLAGVQIDYDVDDARLLLRPRLRPRLVTLAARTERLNDRALGMALHLDNGRVVLVADGRVRLNNEAPRIDQLLLVGDRLVVAGRTWLVSG
jgi:tetratricopeptide (TPR) repeat protein